MTFGKYSKILTFLVAVAQWQSIALWMRGLWVQPPSATPKNRISFRGPVQFLSCQNGKSVGEIDGGVSQERKPFPARFTVVGLSYATRIMFIQINNAPTH